MVELVDTLGLGSNSLKSRGSIPLFDILLKKNFLKCIAQSVEQWTFNPRVLGSTPSTLNFCKRFIYLEFLYRILTQYQDHKRI